LAEAAETVLMLRLGLLAPFRESELDEMEDQEVENLMIIQQCISQYEAALMDVKGGMAQTPETPPSIPVRGQPSPGGLRQRTGRR